MTRELNVRRSYAMKVDLKEDVVGKANTYPSASPPGNQPTPTSSQRS